MAGLSIAKSLELQLLQPGISHDDVRSGCELAAANHLAAVCVYPVHVRAASDWLAGSDTRVIAAIGFPFGQDLVSTRLHGAAAARDDGADELSVMLDQSLLTVELLSNARHELEQLLESAFWASLTSSRAGGHMTIVLESMLVDLEDLSPIWQALRDSAAAFVQTAGGLQPRAVTEEHVRRLRAVLPADVQIKAAGGVGTLADAHALINAGAVRICSASAAAIAEQERNVRRERRGA